jgi:UDP-3-O-[3-hydroxymyristoyl] glucosamine N-acyltransferase
MTVRELAAWVGGEVVGDGDLSIVAARPLSEAGPGDLTFVETDKHFAAWESSAASAAIAPKSLPVNGKPLIRVRDPLSAFATIVVALRGAAPSTHTGRIDPTAIVHPTARLGPDVTVGAYAIVGAETVLGARCELHPGAQVGRNCRLGDDVTLFPRVVVYDDCVLGDRVSIHAGAVIGADGFGYRTQQGRHIKVPQLGHVEIGNDVEIGACTTIDRGTFGPTRIGDGTKIDNLVMIGHNCQIGRHNLIVGQAGLAGSVTTGDYVVLAGQVGVADHLTIGDGAVVGAQGGVAQSVPPGAKMLGTPARPIVEAHRMFAASMKMADLLKDVRRIKRAIDLGDEE